MLQFVVSELANSHENIRFNCSKPYVFVELAHIYCNSSNNFVSKLRLAKCESSCKMWSHAYWSKFCELGNAIAKLTTNWQKFRWHTDGILITVEKFRERTHHNALRLTSVSQQARPDYETLQCPKIVRSYKLKRMTVYLPKNSRSWMDDKVFYLPSETVWFYARIRTFVRYNLCGC